MRPSRTPSIHRFTSLSLPVRFIVSISSIRAREEILEAIKEHVSYARSKFEVVEFSPEDATRTELDFLLQVVQTAVDAGASYINIP